MAQVNKVANPPAGVAGCIAAPKSTVRSDVEKARAAPVAAEFDCGTVAVAVAGYRGLSLAVIEELAGDRPAKN
ncbi:hypothetical protein [Nocardia farcinica]|uniref:hypothetical protein n=1 Tax=Nocardia farcinica TaxID=37329 RepID=UPI002456336F|nr:hypothetical protein [Nocardia farcinica]